MGLETLDGFRDSLNLVLGDKAQGNERLDRWINDGLQELFALLDIEARRQCAEAVTVVDQEAYALPADLLATLVLTDRTNKRRLLKTSIENFEQLDPSRKGKPKIFARIDRQIFLNPVPNGVFTLHLTYLRESTPLVNGTDVTEMTAAYDRVVHLLAARSAMIDLGEEERATFLFQVARNRMREIPTEFDLESENPAEGIQVATSRDDLTQPPQILR